MLLLLQKRFVGQTYVDVAAKAIGKLCCKSDLSLANDAAAEKQ